MITAVVIFMVATFLPFKLISFFRGRQFGGKVRQKHKEKYRQSPHWDGKKFQNLAVTTMDVNLKTIPRLLIRQMNGRTLRGPKRRIPVVPFDAGRFTKGDLKPKFVWYGHSALLLQLNGKNLLIDPMFGSDASPIAPVRSPRFTEQSLEIIDTLPAIDLMLLTHDHYDHLDFDSIEILKSKVSRYFVALGINRHLERWGIPADQVTEFDWWQENEFAGIQFRFTPSRHFSGRGPTDRAKSLWGGWIIATGKHRIYWSGDGGYGEHFQQIGRQYGPFDWAFIECGQYNELWHQIHLYPEESVQAAIDARVQVAIPVHWGGFSLAMHHWTDPIQRFVASAGKMQQKICTPHPGEIVRLGDEPKIAWWEKYA